MRESTIALEFVPPDAEDGRQKARAEAVKVLDMMQRAGIADRVNTLLVPGLIAEESDRPMRLQRKMDPLEVRQATADTLPLDCIVTQVTAYSSAAALGERLAALRSAKIERVVFVGVPRPLADGEGPGLAPTDALRRFRKQVPHRGVILIPSRQHEKARFEAKVEAGATFAVSQMLFSDCIISLLATLEIDGPRPEILLSFGYVPKAEGRVGLIRWLIRDETEQARQEMDWMLDLAERPFAQKKTALIDLYKRITDGLRSGDHPLGIHFECPYGFNEYAFEVFHAMLDCWSPDAP